MAEPLSPGRLAEIRARAEAATRTAVPDLLAEVDRLRRQVTALELADMNAQSTHRREVRAAAAARVRLAAAREKGRREADEWNACYPVGTAVVAYPCTRDCGERLATRTRSVAWLLGHGEPVVMVEGYAGGIYLTHVDVDVLGEGGDHRG